MTEYACRARRMMKTYGRGGRTRIYWLTLPTPGRGFFRKTFPAVNAAIRRAGARSRRRGGDRPGRRVHARRRYRDSMRIGDRPVRVRQSDRVHLNAAGASLAAR